MKILPHENSSWVYVVSSNPKLKEWLQFSVKPQTQRYYVEELRSWALHRAHLLAAVRMGLRYGHVDYSLLETEAQLAIASAKSSWRTGRMPTPTDNNDSAYSVMHLLPSAPQGIVDVVFRYLAKTLHPDAGGNEEEFKQLNDAYQRIKNAK